MPNTGLDQAPLHVAVAAIVNARHEVLLSLRPDHVHQGGLWEFPGGKVEPDESVNQALMREIHEELGIRVGATRPLIRIHHRYPDREVLLDVWRVEDFDGDVQGREGQTVEWVPIRELGERTFPAANRPIIQALQLPRAYLITPDPGSDQAGFLRQLQVALEAGGELIQLRAPTCSPEDYARLATQVVPLCHRFKARVLLNADAGLVDQTGADGLHLNSQRLAQYTDRPLPEDRLLIASCHNREQLAHAGSIGVDAVVLSPVQATASHPEAQPLGWERFAELVEPCPFPVYALGGMTASDIAMAQVRGGQGVAAIRALWPKA